MKDFPRFVANVTIDTKGIDEHIERAEKLLDLLQQAKQLIGELATPDLLNPEFASGNQDSPRV